MFKVGDRVVHKSGIGKIAGVENKAVRGETFSFFRIELYSKRDVTLYVPSVKPRGIRSLISKDDVDDFYQRVQEPESVLAPPTEKPHWRKEFRSKKDAIERGNFFERTLVYIKLKYKPKPTPVDHGMLHEVEDLLIREISLTMSKMPRDIKRELDKLVDMTISQQQEDEDKVAA